MFSVKNDWLRVSAIYLIIFIVVSITSYLFFSQFKLLYTDVDSARYVLSSLIQSEATILAIVVTLSLVAVQLASSSSARVIDIFKRTPDLWILIILYIFAIAYCVTLLKLILNTQNRISNLENYILFAYYISMSAFISLMPYIWNILDLMKPSTVIDKLAERITNENILKATLQREGLEGEKGRVMKHDDPIQPLVDIINASLMKYDYGTFREGLIAIHDSTIKILSAVIDEKEKEKIIKHVSDHLLVTRRLAVESDNEDLIDKILADLQRN